MAQKIGIVDTMFARYDMGSLAEKTIHEKDRSIEIIRYTVPGIKDTPVAAKKLIEKDKCNIVLATGMVGKAPIDIQCAHEANCALQQAQLMTNTHILGVMVYEHEAKNEKELITIFQDRTKKHACNALALLQGKDALRIYAGQGKRQGSEDTGSIGEIK